jgi:hypothetical protein
MPAGMDHRNEFICTHMDILVAPDAFATEVWTWGELMTYDV